MPRGVCRCDECLVWRSESGLEGFCRIGPPSIGEDGWGRWPKTKPDDGCHQGIPRPKGATGKAAPPDEVEWRVDDTWNLYLRSRERHYTQILKQNEPPRPVLTKEIREAIVAAMREHDWHLLESREAWKENSRTRAAGAGIFLSAHHQGKNEQGRSYLEASRPWVKQRGKPDPVSMFSEIYFAEREKRREEMKRRGAQPPT